MSDYTDWYDALQRELGKVKEGTDNDTLNK
jgi:hypothetical protein